MAGHIVNKPPVRSSPRFHLLDGLRIFAALCVMVYHFTARENVAWGIPVAQVFPDFSRFSALGAFGVQLFFVISGFVILLSAWNRSLIQFTSSRVARLFPAYWVSVILTSFLLLVLWPEGREINVLDALTNLTMLQDPLEVRRVNGVYWTLWVELKFYLLMGVFIVVGITRSRVFMVAALWPLAAAISDYAEFPLLSELLMPEYAPFFAGGMILFLIHREGGTVLSWLVLGLNVVFAAQQTVNGQFGIIKNNTGIEIPDYVCWLVVFFIFVLVAAVTLTRLSTISGAFFSTAGALTFPLYLLHEYWGHWFIHVLVPHLPQRLTLIVSMLLCIVMAWLVWRYVEIPVGPRLKAACERGLRRFADRDEDSAGNMTERRSTGTDQRRERT